MKKKSAMESVLIGLVAICEAVGEVKEFRDTEKGISTEAGMYGFTAIRKDANTKVITFIPLENYNIMVTRVDTFYDLDGNIDVMTRHAIIDPTDRIWMNAVLRTFL